MRWRSALTNRRAIMHRRIVLTGLAAAVASPALAQSQQPAPIPVTPQSAGNQPGAAGSLYQSQSSQMGQAEVQHLQQTLAAGTVSLQTSEIALQKAQNAAVKQFAGFERDEQTTIAEVLRSMQEPVATASSGSAAAAASGGAASASATGGSATAAVATAPEIPADKARMMEELQQAKAGPEFDRMYIQGQLQGHQELLQIQERYLQGNSRNREHVNAAKLARGHIKEHIARLQDIQKELRG
jgi:putative membrane protein